MSSEPWPREQLRTLTELEAYDTMRAFLEAYWERGLKASDDIAVLLGSTNRDAHGPLDPAQWSDWREAVGKVVKHKPEEKPE
jgi:hypothetical protein